MSAILLVVLVGATAIAAVARRGVVHPGLIVVVVAAAASFLPGLERLEFESDVILSVVMPPLLYSAALHFSFFNFLRNFRAIFGLGVVMVVFVTLIVGWTTQSVAAALGIPALAGGMAFVLASVVSPPDTVTTVTRGRELGLPKRVVDVLTGESLVNDAAALTLFAITLAAVTGGETLIENPYLFFLYESVAGVLIGGSIAAATLFVRRRTKDSTIEAAMSILVPFASYFVAEQIEASGVIAVVIAGFLMSTMTTFDTSPSLAAVQAKSAEIEQTRGTRGGRRKLRRVRHVRTPSPVAYSTRITERRVWPVIDTLLESFVFGYMGIQLRFIIEDLVEGDASVSGTLILAGVVLAIVIASRLAWVFLTYGSRRFKSRRVQARRMVSPAAEARAKRREKKARLILSWPEMFLVGWTGMRGIVTLAAAASIPLTAEGSPIPGRETVQIVAFVVAVGTFVIQGLTLPFIARKIGPDLSEEIREEEKTVAEIEKRIAHFDAHDFAGQRQQLMDYLIENPAHEEMAQVVLARIDLREAAYRDAAAN